MGIRQFLTSLREKIKPTREDKDQPPNDPQIIPVYLSAHSDRTIQHHPSTDEMQHRATERYYWQEQRRLAQELNNLTRTLNWITAKGTVVALTGLIGLYYTFAETRRQANIAEQTLRATQRPYVSLGKADGIIVEYAPPPEGERKGALLVFFQNNGVTPALSFLANVYSWWPLAQSEIPDRHIMRWRGVDKQGRGAGRPIYPNVTIGANSIQAVVIDQKWIPSHEEWELMKAGKLEHALTLGGNLEYCDQWGKLHCEMFNIRYEPPPVDRFVASTHECPPGFPPPVDKAKLGVGDDIEIIVSPPCEQPGEREAEGKN
jgi:hypothetical protein